MRSLVPNLKKLITVFFLAIVALFTHGQASIASTIVGHVVDPTQQHISLHWKDGRDSVIGNIGSLAAMIERSGKSLLFAMNGGMYMEDQSPLGLYIENGRLLTPMNRKTERHGNFYLQPNGVFGIYTDGRAFVKVSGSVEHIHDITFATQSGPMLVGDGAVNKLFTPGSKNVHIRNGVGMLPDGRVLFAISTSPVNFHDFASYFKEQGCREALYLDGAISKAFMPDQGLDQRGGQLGVLIAVTAAE